MNWCKKMNKVFPSRPEPEWLATVSEKHPLPLSALLQNSLYYPACGRDGDPVRFFGGFIHSFVYADYFVSQQEITESLYHPQYGFKGYRVLFCKDVSTAIAARATTLSAEVKKGLARARRSVHRPVEYAIWVVLERLEQFDSSHGPSRFSYLFIGGEGVSVYEALYRSNNIAPEILAVIQCGISFGGAWTDFANRGEILARKALAGSGEKPQFLLHGDWYGLSEKCCWPEYDSEVCRWRAGAQGALGLWRAGVSLRNDPLSAPTRAINKACPTPTASWSATPRKEKSAAPPANLPTISST
jgi:hypothetical protein